MAKANAATPNERLLEMVRRPDGEPQEPTPPKKTSRKRLGFFSLGATVSVGVDISPTRLTCVRVRGRDAGFELLGAVVVPVPEEAQPGNMAFADLLRRTLSDLCGPGPMPRIWAAAQSARVNLQFVTFPKVTSHQVDNAVFWTAKKEMGFDEAAVVFDFERRGEVTEKGASRLGAMAYTAPREAVELVRGDFVKAGFTLAGLTLEPFAHQNLLRRRVVPETAGAVANLHVGQDWSRLEIYHDGNLMFVRVIKTSMSGMEQAVQESLEARLGDMTPVVEQGMSLAPGAAAEPVLDLDVGEPDGPGLVLELETETETPQPLSAATESRPHVSLEQARELLESIIYGCEHLDTCQPGEGLGPEDVMAMLEPVASRLVRQVEMTLKHYRESLGYEAVSHLMVSGPLGGSRLFLSYIGEQTGLPCTAFDPLRERASRLPDAGGRRMPGSAWTQALGLAFSEQSLTPNVLSTYREKAAARTSRLLEQWSLITLAVVLATMAYFSFDAASTRRTLTRELDRLKQESAALGSSMDPANLSRLTGELRSRCDVLRTYARRNQTTGVWERLLALAPEDVGVGSITTEFGPPSKAAGPEKGRSSKQGHETRRLVVEGMITGDARLFDSKLASYVVALERSAVFGSVSVRKSNTEALEAGATGLRYTLGVELR